MRVREPVSVLALHRARRTAFAHCVLKPSASDCGHESRDIEGYNNWNVRSRNPLVREPGVEPGRLAAPEPKRGQSVSGVSGLARLPRHEASQDARNRPILDPRSTIPLEAARAQWARAVAGALREATARWERSGDSGELRRALLEILRALG